MRKFKDEAGREWIVRVDVGTIRRARDRHSIDLDGILSESEPLRRLADDIVLRVDILWCCVEEQAKQRGVTAGQFAEGLYGEAIESATEALMEAIIDFFPKSRRDLMLKVWNKSREKAAADLVRIEAAVDQFLSEKPYPDSPPMLESIQTD